MKIERLYAYVSELETGRDEIKKLIENVRKSEKENEWYLKDITVEMTGVLFRRTISLENIEKIKLVNDQLKINYSGNVHSNIPTEVYKKDMTISIPINLINEVKVELH